MLPNLQRTKSSSTQLLHFFLYSHLILPPRRLHSRMLSIHVTFQVLKVRILLVANLTDAEQLSRGLTGVENALVAVVLL